MAGGRSSLLRQNDKFMKETKKKAEALAKLRLEMMPKKVDEPTVVKKPAAAPTIAEQ